MSLRKCPDCGKDVSSSAPSCPHCGRPLRKSSLWAGLAGALVLVVTGVVILVRWSGSGSDASGEAVAPGTAPETIVAQPYRQLTRSLSASVGYNRTLYLLRIENRDGFPWSNCQLTLNSQGLTGYELEVELIKPGLTEAALLQSAEFAAASGKKFDPAADKVATLDLDCETPQGRLYYGGRFAEGLAAPPTAAEATDRR